MPVDYKKLKMLRRSRVVWGSWRVWKPRAVFWIGAIAVGLISVGFAWAADRAQHLFFSATSSGEWAFLLPLVVTPLGFTLCAWLALTVFPNAGGSGIPQAIAARHLRDDADRSRLLSLKLAFGKVALTVVGLLSGASIGREGPTVQVGASIMLQAARWGGMAQAKGLILAGSAAGIAAAFNTPLAGIVFAIEEMSKTYESRANGLVLTAVIGIATDGATFGTGYEQARAAIEGQAAPAFFFIEKLAATFLAMMSGIPGGIFAPSLSVGAGFGSTMATLLGTSIGLGAIVGMAGYFAGVVQAPMTAFVIILEMTGNHDGVIPIMVASMLGYLTSRLFSREPLYHGLSRVFIAQSIRAKRAAHSAET